MTDLVPSADAWRDAHLAAALLAIDPGLGGAVVRARPGPAREAWLETVHDLFSDAPSRRIPAGIADEAHDATPAFDELEPGSALPHRLGVDGLGGLLCGRD